MRYKIYNNIKQYIAEFGYEILDLLINPANPTSFIPMERYNEFGKQLDAHLNSTQINKTNFRKMLPLLNINIHDIGTTKGCMHEYIVDFQYSFSAISADQEYCTRITAESIFRQEDRFNCVLNEMMFKTTYDDKGRVATRNLFQYMCSIKEQLKCFDNCLCCVSSVEEDPLENLNIEDEVITLHKQYKLRIGEC